MLITRLSRLTGKIATLDLPVTEAQLAAWCSGTLIQKALWNLSPAEREFIQTGYTPEDWAAMFPTPEDDDAPTE